MEHLGFKWGGMKREIARKPNAIESNVNLARRRKTIADERQITTAEAIVSAAANTRDRASSIDITERAAASDFKLIAAIAISLLLIIGSVPASSIPDWLRHPVWQWLLATPIQFWCIKAVVSDVWNAILARRSGSTHRSIYTNVNALIALTTITAYLYSLVSTFAPQISAGANFSQPDVYYAISTTTIVLMFVGRKLENLAKERSQAAISKLIDRQLPINTPLLDRSLALVDRLQVNKLPIPRLADRVTNKYIIPLSLLLTIATSLLWLRSIDNPVSGAIFGCGILIIMCPCALGLATSMAISIGINTAAQREILVNNGDALELLDRANTIVFDKNALVVADRLAVTDFIPIVDRYNGTELNIFQLVASLEACTNDILAAAIVDRAKELTLALKPVNRFQEIAGKGIQGIVDGKLIQIGSNEWISSLDTANILQVGNQRVLTNYQHQWEATGKTVIWIAIDREIAGIIGISAAIAPATIATISRLKRAGLAVVLVATDNLATTKNLADRLKIDRVFACKKSQDKVAVIQKLQSTSIGKYRAIVAMVGSSLNDAPALAQADVSMAIGTSEDLAISFCDLTLATADLQVIITAIKLSRSTLQKIEQNLFFTFIYNLICLPIAAGVFYPQFGLSLTPQIALGAMAASLASVVVNSWRSRKAKN